MSINHTKKHNFYTLLNSIKVRESRRTQGVGHVARRGEMRNAYKILVEKPEGRDNSGYLAVHGNIITEWILGK
jgi:hypothetical protein